MKWGHHSQEHGVAAALGGRGRRIACRRREHPGNHIPATPFNRARLAATPATGAHPGMELRRPGGGRPTSVALAAGALCACTALLALFISLQSSSRCQDDLRALVFRAGRQQGGDAGHAPGVQQLLDEVQALRPLLEASSEGVKGELGALAEGLRAAAAAAGEQVGRAWRGRVQSPRWTTPGLVVVAARAGRALWSWAPLMLRAPRAPWPLPPQADPAPKEGPADEAAKVQLADVTRQLEDTRQERDGILNNFFNTLDADFLGDVEAFKKLLAEQPQPYFTPEVQAGWKDRGIVISAGGAMYTANAFVNAYVIRHHFKCKLPIVLMCGIRRGRRGGALCCTGQRAHAWPTPRGDRCCCLPACLAPPPTQVLGRSAARLVE